MPDITVGFVPRERFSVADKCLQRLVECTKIPFTLVILDCNTPSKYQKRLLPILNGIPHVKTIRTDQYCLPNKSRNLVIQECDTEYLCFIENDVWAEDGWLAFLLDALENAPADVAAPLIIEGEGDGGVHFDWRLEMTREIKFSEGTKLEILPKDNWDEYTSGNLERKRVEFIEQHCMLFRRKVFEDIGLFDEEINTRMEIDMSLALRSKGVSVVFEPKSRVHFLPPENIEDEERAYFRFRWDLDTARLSHERINDRWKLINCPSSLPFVEDRASNERYK